MRFQYKVIFVFCTAMFVLLAGMGELLGRQARRHVLQEVGAKLKAAASATALMIDGDKHEALAQSRSMESPQYDEVLQQLRRVQKALRGDVANVYTMRKTGTPDVWEFVVDASETDDRAPLGKAYDVSKLPQMRQAFNGPIADEQIARDEWGSWLSAYSPIYDSRGRPVAIVGMDASAAAIHDMQWTEIVSILLALVCTVLLSVPIDYVVGRLLSREVRGLVHAADRVAGGDLDYRVPVRGADEFSALAAAFNRMTAGLKERDFVKETLEKYVSREVAERILGPDLRQALRGERRHLSVLFTDMRRFGRLAEAMTPEELLQMLNEYFTLLIDVLFEFEGTLDKFVGDGLMAMFGAPITHPDDSERAVRAAVKMQEKLQDYNRERRRKGLVELTMGIGINSGTAVAGNIGSERRKEYSVVGDTVNVAARLQEIAEGGEIIISQSTYDEVKGKVRAEKMPPQTLRGRAEPMQLYRVLAIEPA